MFERPLARGNSLQQPQDTHAAGLGLCCCLLANLGHRTYPLCALDPAAEKLVNGIISPFLAGTTKQLKRINGKYLIGVRTSHPKKSLHFLSHFVLKKKKSPLLKMLTPFRVPAPSWPHVSPHPTFCVQALCRHSHHLMQLWPLAGTPWHTAGASQGLRGLPE